MSKAYILSETHVYETHTVKNVFAVYSSATRRDEAVNKLAEQFEADGFEFVYVVSLNPKLPSGWRVRRNGKVETVFSYDTFEINRDCL